MRIIFYFTLLVMLFGCSESEEKDWTILVYMAADNELTTSAAADIEEMTQADFSDDIKIIVQIDYSETHSPTGTYRYEILPGEQNLIKSLGEIDSGSDYQLSAFANWGFSKYSARKNALIIWSHGNGWYPKNREVPPSFCSDNESDSYISIADGEFADAMENIDQQLDILIMDACNMQTVEVAAEIYQEIDFIIAAEDGVNAQGFPYKKNFSMWEDFTSTEYLAIQIAQDFHYFYWSEEIYPISCSVLKTSEFPTLLNKLTDFTQDWNFSLESEPFTTSRENCIEFNGSFSVSKPTDVDIKEWFAYVQNEAMGMANYELTIFAQEILAIIDSAYIFQYHEDYLPGYPSENVGSALIWFPDQDTEGVYNQRKEAYEKLQFHDTGWLSFIQSSFQNN